MGQAVCAVVQAGAGYDEAAVRDELHLAGYKQPKALHATPKSLRAPNGKADYGKAKALADRIKIRHPVRFERSREAGCRQRFSTSLETSGGKGRRRRLSIR
ncbi:hypothetical protein AB5I41_02960 [Sphingomonas sp. MMS24-JH45]